MDNCLHYECADGYEDMPGSAPAPVTYLGASAMGTTEKTTQCLISELYIIVLLAINYSKLY